MSDAAIRAPGRVTPLWARLMGCRYYDGGTARTRWGEFTPRGWGISFKIGAYETAHVHFMLGWGSFFIRARCLDRLLNAGAGMDDTLHYGFDWKWPGSDQCNALWLQWGKRGRMYDYPWRKNYVVREFLGADGQWHEHRQMHRSWMPEGEGIEPWAEKHPYHYLLPDGEVQHVTATITRERNAVVWQWFGRGRLTDFLRRISPHKITHYIEIEFDGEVGEEAGSWKGGCIGCSEEMRPDETPVMTLRRMQQTRRFR